MRWIFPVRTPDPRDAEHPVHDGDTLQVTLDRGYGDRSNHAERLRFVFAPELKDPGGAETYAKAVEWVYRFGGGSGWPMSVETFTTKTGNDIMTFGRYVAMVYAGDPEDVRTREASLPCLNRFILEFLAQHPEWGGGTGG